MFSQLEKLPVVLLHSDWKPLPVYFAAGQPLTSLERIADGAAVAVLARDRYTDEGNRPFMRYCFKKTAEIANVRIVMSCLNNGAEKAVKTVKKESVPA